MTPNEDRRRAPPQGVGEDPVRTLADGHRPDAATPPQQIPMPTPPVAGDPRHPPTTQLDQDQSPAGDRGDGGHRHAEDLRQVSGVPDVDGPKPSGHGNEPATEPPVEPPSRQGARGR